MREEIVGQVRAVQAAMAQAAEPYFGEWYLDDLRCVVRLTVEFYYFLQDWESVSGDAFELRYAGESVFSGVDSFCSVSGGCRGGGISTKSAIQWEQMSLASVREQFLARYGEFAVETDFDKRCRLLPDLFRLQIVFAGMSYE